MKKLFSVSSRQSPVVNRTIDHRLSAIDFLLMLGASLALSGCVSNWDMQGNDPKDFYAAHPIKNTLAAHEQAVLVHFPPRGNVLPPVWFTLLKTGGSGIPNWRSN